MKDNKRENQLKGLGIGALIATTTIGLTGCSPVQKIIQKGTNTVLYAPVVPDANIIWAKEDTSSKKESTIEKEANSDNNNKGNNNQDKEEETIVTIKPTPSEFDDEMVISLYAAYSEANENVKKETHSYAMPIAIYASYSDQNGQVIALEELNE